MQKYREPKEYKKGPNTVIDGVLSLMSLYYSETNKCKITDLYDTITVKKWFGGELTFNEFLTIFKENEHLYEKKDNSYFLNKNGIDRAAKVIFY